jgi:hypothetical protein
MTYTEMIARVRLQLTEDNESFYLDTNIGAYITSALHRFMNRTRCGIAKQTVAFVTGTAAYALTYKPNRFRSIVLVPTSDADDREIPFTQVSYEDWQRFSADYREDTYVCYVDNQNSLIYFPSTIDSGSVYLEYSILPTDATTAAIIDANVIPELYHEAITDYCLFLAFRKDREFNIANSYFQSYYAVEQEAIKEVAEHEHSSIMDDFSTENTNPHRQSDTHMQDIAEI